jgi:hypothetical protein
MNRRPTGVNSPLNHSPRRALRALRFLSNFTRERDVVGRRFNLKKKNQKNNARRRQNWTLLEGEKYHLRMLVEMFKEK